MKILVVCCLTLCLRADTESKTPMQQALDVVQEGRSETNVLKRRQFLMSLACAGKSSVTIPILEADLATGKQPEIRQAAAAALGAAKSTASIPKLQKALEDEPDIAFTAARSLWQLGDRSGREFFEQILSGEKVESPGMLKSSLRDARLRMANPKALALMGVKEGLAMFLGPAAMGVTVYQELMKDQGATTRAIAATMLATDTHKESLKALEEGLSDKNWIVRATCAKALAERSSIASIPKLANLLDDKADEPRYTSAAAIIRLEESRKHRKPRLQRPQNAAPVNQAGPKQNGRP
jgi:HEAT repeat protein